MRRYPLAYRIETSKEHPPRTAEELLEEKLGGCDAIILHSILFRDDGGRSEARLSLDGRTGEDLSADELFKSWTAMAGDLALDERLGESRRVLAGMVFEVMRTVIAGKPSPLWDALKEIAQRYS